MQPKYQLNGKVCSERQKALKSSWGKEERNYKVVDICVLFSFILPNVSRVLHLTAHSDCGPGSWSERPNFFCSFLAIIL
jgi:hypothetical protein